MKKMFICYSVLHSAACLFALDSLFSVGVPVNYANVQNLSFMMHYFPGSYTFLCLFALKIHL